MTSIPTCFCCSYEIWVGSLLPPGLSHGARLKLATSALGKNKSIACRLNLLGVLVRIINVLQC